VATDCNEVDMMMLNKDHHGCFPLVVNKEEVLSSDDSVFYELWIGLLIFFIKFKPTKSNRRKNSEYSDAAHKWD